MYAPHSSCSSASDVPATGHWWPPDTGCIVLPDDDDWEDDYF